MQARSLEWFCESACSKVKLFLEKNFRNSVDKEFNYGIKDVYEKDQIL
jgi:hypothetical protein